MLAVQIQILTKQNVKAVLQPPLIPLGMFWGKGVIQMLSLFIYIRLKNEF